MAIRLDKAFGGSAETWLRLQMACDLAQAGQHEGAIKVKPVARRKLHEPRAVPMNVLYCNSSNAAKRTICKLPVTI